MKIKGHRRGFMLIEALVYLSLVFVIAGGAMVLALKLTEHSKRLKNKTNLIAKTLQIGEIWRKEIRNAEGEIQQREADGLRELRIPTEAGDVFYVHLDDSLWRVESENPEPVLLIDKIQNSKMVRETRGDVTVWRWEIELPSRREVARVKPHFTFQAVQGFNK
jgi:hypothetical protein